MSEAIYDEQIVPLLLQAAKICEEHGLPMVTVVEYADGVRGETRTISDESSLAMRMLSLLAAAGNNLDRFLINVIRLCNKEGISLDESMFLRQYGTQAKEGKP